MGEAYTGKLAGHRERMHPPEELIQPRNRVGDADGEVVNVTEASTEGSLERREPEGPSGSTKTVACQQRSDLELGRPVCAPGPGRERDNRRQLNEAAEVSARESDPSIVVGDGRADHMAKGGAEGQRLQSTHAAARKAPQQSVSSSLRALEEKARRESAYRFRDLYGMIDDAMLYECYGALRRQAAPGVDGIDVEEYGVDLGRNIADLVERLKAKRYRAQLVKRVYIPKGGGKERPLGLPVVEDKLVQMAVAKILSAVFEVDFTESSNGYRPGRGARGTTQKLRERLFKSRVRVVVEADIEGFFENIDHGWLERMLEERINDRAFVGLIRKWLKAGIFETDGRIMHPGSGTPQGGVVSPILANIYLHYVLDVWMERRIGRNVKGDLVYERYADDFVCGFEYRSEAEAYLNALRKRLPMFGLRMAEAKSGIVEFNRHRLKESKAFVFLGFDFYWSRTRRGYVTLKRRTSGKKFRLSLGNITDWLRRNRNERLGELGEELERKLRGYNNYYGVIGNSESLKRFWHAVKGLVYKWLNRRSQRRSYNWKGFAEMWRSWGIPNPRIVEEAYGSKQRSFGFTHT